MPTRRIALLHYSASPVVGGVETVLHRQAEVLQRHGHEVRIITGTAQPEVMPGVRQIYIPELATDHPTVLSLRAQPPALSFPGEEFGALADNLKRSLGQALQGSEIAIVHNMMTMHFNPAASVALATLAAESSSARWINWVHDVAAARALDLLADAYAIALPEIPAGFRNVAVSELRRRQLIEHGRVKECLVIPNGIEPAASLALPPRLGEFVAKHRLLERDLVLLQPTRLLARKNVEFAIEVLTALRAGNVDAVLVVTGAPDPHNPASAKYAAALREHVSAAHAENGVLFAGEHFAVGESELAALYRVADALIFPSREEGFGLPLLEAALHRIPAFASDIEPFREHSGQTAAFFPPDASPAEAAELIRSRMEQDTPHRRRKRTVQQFSWQAIYRQFMAPLLED